MCCQFDKNHIVKIVYYVQNKNFFKKLFTNVNLYDIIENVIILLH